MHFLTQYPYYYVFVDPFSVNIMTYSCRDKCTSGWIKIELIFYD